MTGPLERLECICIEIWLKLFVCNAVKSSILHDYLFTDLVKYVFLCLLSLPRYLQTVLPDYSLALHSFSGYSVAVATWGHKALVESVLL